METPVVLLGCESGNVIYLKRDDLFPFSFGGNKARITRKYFESIDGDGYDSVVTYGGPASNLCRAVASAAAQRGLPCIAVMHGEEPRDPVPFNLQLVRLSGARTVFCPVSQVSAAVDAALERLLVEGRRPFFIPGGGQGAPGTQAYLECYDEILAYEDRVGAAFDYLFLPSGTGTTQSGLVCGKLLRGGAGKIVGVSIARTAERGRGVILRNVRDFFAEKGVPVSDEAVEDAVLFEDGYTGGGYGKGDYTDTIARIRKEYAVAFDNTYTAKAFAGMKAYLKSHGITGQRVLFLHTGSAPLFFDCLRRESHGRGER